MANPNTCQEISVYDHLTNKTVLIEACSNDDLCHYLATGIASLVIFLGFAACCMFVVSARSDRRKPSSSPPSYEAVWSSTVRKCRLQFCFSKHHRVYKTDKPLGRTRTDTAVWRILTRVDNSSCLKPLLRDCCSCQGSNLRTIGHTLLVFATVCVIGMSAFIVVMMVVMVKPNIL